MSATIPSPSNSELRDQQMRQAEELLFSEVSKESFAKGLFQGRFANSLLMPYPHLEREENAKVESALTELRDFCDQHLDAAQIDRQADIPQSVIEGLGRLGILGMTAPESVGGRDFSQFAYCRLLEELGARCCATSIFVKLITRLACEGCCCLEPSSKSNAGFPTW